MAARLYLRLGIIVIYILSNNMSNGATVDCISRESSASGSAPGDTASIGCSTAYPHLTSWLCTKLQLKLTFPLER